MLVVDVGKRLKELRSKTSLEQDDVAEALGKSSSTISHWETGRRDMNFKDVYDYHEVLKPLVGDNWNYVCTGKKISSESDSAYVSKIEMLDKLAVFLEECRSYRVLSFKGDAKEVTTMFAAKHFAEPSSNGNGMKKAN